MLEMNEPVTDRLPLLTDWPGWVAAWLAPMTGSHDWLPPHHPARSLSCKPEVAVVTAAMVSTTLGAFFSGVTNDDDVVQVDCRNHKHNLGAQ